MRGLRWLFLAAALAGAGGAYAQATPAAPARQPSQPGFFPPTPGDDPSLFHTLPPEAYAKPQGEQPSARAGSQPAPANAAAPIVVVVPDANAEAHAAELERARIEAQQAADRMRQAPAPINGAFTGATDEADRR